MSTAFPATGDRAVAIDVGAVVLVSAVSCATQSALEWMWPAVSVALVLRLAAWSRLPARERGPWSAELLFFALCIGLGAFNDWNSVHRHRIYDYTAPLERPDWSLVPLWMLVFWGMILRLVVTVGRWERLGGWTRPLDRVAVFGCTRSSAALALAVQLAIVVVTRQAIYVSYAHPVWSWLPFALGLAVYVAVLRPPVPVRRLMLIAAVVGPLVEVLYIQVGHLHRYALGWIGGVPLWIALWWILAIPIWVDVSLRVQRGGPPRARHEKPPRGRGS